MSINQTIQFRTRCYSSRNPRNVTALWQINSEVPNMNTICTNIQELEVQIYTYLHTYIYIRVHKLFSLLSSFWKNKKGRKKSPWYLSARMPVNPCVYIYPLILWRRLMRYYMLCVSSYIPFSYFFRFLCGSCPIKIGDYFFFSLELLFLYRGSGKRIIRLKIFKTIFFTATILFHKKYKPMIEW
jgi:hypothetical protein